MEYLTGTNPTDPKSNLQVHASSTESGIVLRWLSAPGKAYRIECAPDLLNGPWDVLATGLPGSGQVEQWVHTKPTRRVCFYRIGLEN